MKHNKELNHKYSNTPRKRKAGVRKEWIADELVVALEEKEALESLTITEWEAGEWMTLKQLSVALGNDPEAAANWAQSCIEIGPSQYKLDVRKI